MKEKLEEEINRVLKKIEEATQRNTESLKKQVAELFKQYEKD